jgi:DNA-binding transcriptional MerR regulator
MRIEAMKQALEALEEPHAHIAKQLRLEAIHAIKEGLQAIAETEKQEQGEPLIWSTTQGGAYECGEYLVVQRVDDKGWNALKEHKQLLLGASLENCKSICERDAVESLAKREQDEPVAWIAREEDTGELMFDVPEHEAKNGWSASFPVYTTPQQRTWVGLTNEERLKLYRKFEDCLESDGWEYEKAIEHKLKEKNT